MKLRSFFSVLSGVVLVLLLVGAAGAYWLTSARPSAPFIQPAKLALQPAATLFVTRQAPLMASLLVNPDRLALLEKPGEASNELSTASIDRPGMTTQLKQWQQSLLAETNLDYERDVQTWLGDEVTFAITSADVDRDPQNGLQPGHLLVLSVQNSELARESIQRFWQRRTKNLTTDSFAGVTLTYAADNAGQTRPASQLTSAIVGDRYVLFANAPKVMRDALNTAQVPELGLDRSFDYQQALEKFSTPKLGLVFANLKQFDRWQPESSFLSALVPEQIGAFESLVTVVKPEANGLLADVMLFLKEPGSQPIETDRPINLGEILKFVPNGSNVALVNQDLQQTWQQWQNDLSDQPWAQNWQKTIADLQQQWGIDFSETILTWAKGSFTLAQVPSSNSAQPDWLFVTHRSPEIAAGIEQLNQIAQQQGVSLGSFPLGDQTIYAWTKLVTGKANPTTGISSLEAKVQGVHTAIGDYEIFATSLEAMERSLVAWQGTPTSSEMQTAAAHLQTPNAGYLYLNPQNLGRALQKLVGSEALVKPSESGVRSAVVSSYGIDEIGLRAGIFLNLKHK